MNNKYITSTQLLFTNCKVQLTCNSHDLEKISKELKRYGPTFNIFSINEKEKYMLVSMSLIFINKITTYVRPLNIS